MRQVLVCLLALLSALPVTAIGAGLIVLCDQRDSYQSVRAAQLDPAVARQVEALRSELVAAVPCTLPDVERALGQTKGHQPDTTYVMPLAQRREVLLSGLHVRGQSKQHCEFYQVNDICALLVWYEQDSTTVAESMVYLKWDAEFVPMTPQTENELGARLRWDEKRLADFKQALRTRVEDSGGAPGRQGDDRLWSAPNSALHAPVAGVGRR